jgi:EPS-associated MarR family transcriptional regulator
MKPDYQYRILKQIHDNPRTSQRELAKITGSSLGKVNYCLHALTEKGLVKISNFKKSHNRRAYIYKLTPRGIEEKIRLTSRFLQIRMQEYEEIKADIKELKKELEQSSDHMP